MSPGIAAFPKCYINDIGPGKKMNLSEWIEMSVQLEAEGLEMYGPFLDSYEEAYLQKIRSAVESKGMIIPMYCCTHDLVNPDPEIWVKQIEAQRKDLQAAATLGCGTCRVLSGQRHPEVSKDDGIASVVSAIQSLLPLAHELNIKLAMENHYKDSSWNYPEFAQKEDVFLRIVNAIDDEFFGVQYDPANAIVAGSDHIEFLQQVKNRLVSLHAADRNIVPGHTLDELPEDGNLGVEPILRHGEVGKGLSDYPRIFAILAEINYQGWISIEDGENGMDEMKRSIDFLKGMRRDFFN